MRIGRGRMGWPMDQRTRRLAWLGAVVLTITAAIAVFALVSRPADAEGWLSGAGRETNAKTAMAAVMVRTAPPSQARRRDR